MYKINITPGADNTTKIVSISIKKKFLNVTYWNTIERVLCNNQYVEYHIDHFTSKYNFTIENMISETIKSQQIFKIDTEKNSAQVNEAATSLIVA